MAQAEAEAEPEAEAEANLMSLSMKPSQVKPSHASLVCSSSPGTALIKLNARFTVLSDPLPPLPLPPAPPPAH